MWKLVQMLVRFCAASHLVAVLQAWRVAGAGGSETLTARIRCFRYDLRKSLLKKCDWCHNRLFASSNAVKQAHEVCNVYHRQRCFCFCFGPSILRCLHLVFWQIQDNPYLSKPTSDTSETYIANTFSYFNRFWETKPIKKLMDVVAYGQKFNRTTSGLPCRKGCCCLVLDLYCLYNNRNCDAQILLTKHLQKTRSKKIIIYPHGLQKNIILLLVGSYRFFPVDKLY